VIKAEDAQEARHYQPSSVRCMQPSNKDVARSTAETEAAMAPQNVPVNVYETSGALVLVAPVPAVSPDDVTVELRPGPPASLRFWARVRSAGPREFLIHEWEYGGYEREIDLPADYGRGVEATLNNGQLVVRVLRGEASERQEITPKSSSA
jgi:HSP20 family molecular chaperone IbpA